MNRDNLSRLADYLESLPPDYEQFLMSVYNLSTPGCGTVACAAGHGPLAGIPVPLSCRDEGLPTGDVDWMCYAREGFLPGIPSLEYEHVWMFVFGPEWTGIDNSPQGAAARIRHLLEHGTAPPRSEWAPGPWIRGEPASRATIDRLFGLTTDGD